MSELKKPSDTYVHTSTYGMGHFNPPPPSSIHLTTDFPQIKSFEFKRLAMLLLNSTLLIRPINSRHGSYE